MTTPIDVPATLTGLGFTVLGSSADVHGVTPWQAFKSVINLAVEPDERVDSDAPDELGRTEQAWRTRARAAGVLDENDACHLLISGPGTSSMPWYHVRLPAEPFLERLQERTGKIDFVAIAAGGSPVVGLTEEEDENWIVVTHPTPG
ncbi:hypothetical protein [Labedaea rhizosphaerae]|uniref:Uncharacterized protein n=1 Tax=Labedaea rhizosphaerae TaxID=598644 RepID=A0A4R6SGS4_LABRH|nr:hypothetical protein [Labedaea rhizosphaerae]TDQ00955.1 hypothetical protein EV186_102821 [Labedaea rhizosphaerae]